MKQLEKLTLAFQSKYSRFNKHSVLSEINEAAGSGRKTLIDKQTYALLTLASELYDASHGLFDASSGVLQRAWDFKAMERPSEEMLAPLLDLVDWRKVKIEADSVYLEKKGMTLDFGGIGKEYACDLAKQFLCGIGYHHGYINFGGDIVLLGPHPNGKPWRCGIQHPEKAGTAITTIDLSTGALTTSGDYEKSFVQDGVRYCHILNPKTGYSIQSKWRSVSVVAENATLAGTYATLAMLLSDQKSANETFDLSELRVPTIAVAKDYSVSTYCFS